MKWRFVASVLLLAVLGLLVVGRINRHPPARTLTTNSTASAPETSVRIDQHARPLSLQARAEERTQRDALRAEIARVQALQAAQHESAERQTAPSSTQPPQVYPPGNMRDRIGGRDALLKSLNQDFMPLAQECIARAQEQQPALKGLLAISLETLSDEQLGAVVDVAEAAPNNEIANPDLLECVRETAYSLRLPPPPTTGREKFMLTLPVFPGTDMGSR